jgi:A/G-specific adenine glycosylase
MRLSDRQIAGFQKKIFSWWNIHKRDLPWRHTNDPYKITVSEIMLQQTQVSRVIPKYLKFITRYPTVTNLSNATPSQVINIWKGMGYNRRALYIHNIAKIVQKKYRGVFPNDEQVLMKLPGIGVYTARAITIFAFHSNIACVDTNIRQIIIHFFFLDKPQKESIIQDVADQLLPVGKSWEWHQALMDYGAAHFQTIRVLKARNVCQPVPFHKSNRFYRGRIIDLLRKKSYRESTLIHTIVCTYNKPEKFVQMIVCSLIKDGLLVRYGNTLRLPH